MAMSGISVSSECDKAHEDQKKNKKIQWTIYKIEDVSCKEDGPEHHQRGGKRAKHEIVVDYQRPRIMGADDAKSCACEDEIKEKMLSAWMEFVDQLPSDEPRYAIFDYVSLSSGAPNDKFRLIAWSPDVCKTKVKMIYAATKETLIKKLSLPPKPIHLCSKSDDEVMTAYREMVEDK